MTEKTERLSVDLNEAFARLEQAQDSPKSNTTLTGEKNGVRKNERSTNSGRGNLLGVLAGLIAIGIASYALFNTYQLKTSQPVKVVTSAEIDPGRLRKWVEAVLDAGSPMNHCSTAKSSMLRVITTVAAPPRTANR